MARHIPHDSTARNWSPAMRRTVEAMRRYPLAVCKPARLNTGCAACGCEARPNDWPEWPDLDLHAEYPL